VVGIVGARLCWSGVVTLRSTVWASNYPRAIRARIAGKFATIQALVLAGVSVGIGLLMDHDQHAYRWAYPLAAGVGLLGSLAYSRVRIRGHRALLQQERRVGKKQGSMRPSLNPLYIVRFLRLDRHFRRFMICQFLLGTGNMMITAPLIIILTDHYGMDYVDGIAIITTVPILMMPFSIPLWSRLLDRVHIVRFRAVHSWLFVLSNMLLVFTVAHGWIPGLWIAAGIRGIAFGGGVLAWNLGHHDFTNVASSSAYMGVHVSLTGLRGLIAPFLGVVLYESLQGVNPTGWIVFVIALALGIAGAGGFVILSRLLPRDLLDEVR
jgi:MFS family permease